MNATNAEDSVIIPKGASVVAVVFSLLIIIVGICGNGLTIIALIKSNLLSHPTTKFVINLAVTDLLFCSFNLPLTSIRYLTCSWPFGSFLCQLYPFFFYGNVATSLMSITCITINRLILIVFNDRYKRIYTNINVWIMIIFCWLFSFTLVSLPLFKIWGQLGLNESTFSCTILKDDSGRSPKKFLFILGFFLPSLIIIICYTIIWLHVKKEIITNRSLRLTKLICVIFGAFIICFGPLTVGNVFIPENKFAFYHVFASILAWLNSCINPFIYFAMNLKYRNAFKRVLNIRTPISTTESITSDRSRSFTHS